MAYDEALADRVREHMADIAGVSEREMFGGVSFMVAGNLCCGVLGNDLVVRIDPTLHHDALTRPGAREFEMGGRSSRGMIRVAPVGVAEELDLALWLRLGMAQATSRPPKKAAKKKAAAGKKKAAAPAKKKTAAKKAKVPAPKKGAPAKKKAAVKKKKAPAKRAPAVKKKTAVKKSRAPAKKKTAVKKSAAAKKKTAVKKSRAAVKKRAVRARK